MYTGAPEIWYDGVDENCDGRDDFDRDRDGTLAPEGGGTDCDDTNPTLRLGTALVPTQVPTLALALSAACAGATIRMEPGTYATNVVLMRPVSLLGLGGAAQTVLEGSGASAPVIRVGAQAGGTVIEGFTITGGSGSGVDGGGVSAVHGGGPTGTLALKHLLLDGNTAVLGGGGVAIDGWSRVDLEDVELVANRASDGGALRLRNTVSANLTGCDIHDNSAEWQGGGISSDNATIGVTRSSIRGNALTGVGYGGGVFANVSLLHLTEVTLSGNQGALGGALYAVGDGDVALNRVVVAGNSGVVGGGVSISGPSASLHNALIVQNEGGALSIADSPFFDVRSCTVVGNTGDLDSFAVRLNKSSGEVSDIIVAYNDVPGGHAVLVDGAGGGVTLTRVAAFANTDADFNPDAGAPTWTDDPRFVAFDSFLAWDAWDLRLQPTSPYVGVAGDGGDLGAWGGAAAWTP